MTQSAPASDGKARLDRPSLVVAIAIACIQDAVYALIYLSYMNQYLLTVLKSPAGMPGYTLAIFGTCKLITHPLAGRLIDRVSPRLVFQFAIAAQAVGMLLPLLDFDRSLAAFLVGTALVAIGAGAAWPLDYDFVARTQPVELHSTVTGILSFAGYLATGVGFIAGVLLARFAPWPVAFATGLAIVATPVVTNWSRPLGAGPAAKPLEGHALPALHRLTGLAVFGLVVFVDFAAVTSIAGTYGPYTHITLGVSLIGAMALMAPAGVGAVLSLWAAARWSRPGRRMFELALCAAVSAAGLLGLWATSVPLLAALFAIPGAAGLGATGPIVAASIIENGGNIDRGLVIGALMGVEGVGAVVGPAITASVVDLASPAAGMGAIGIMFVVMLVAALLAAKREKPVPHGAMEAAGG